MTTAATTTQSTTLRTTKLPIVVGCPPWCIDTPERHLEDLWNMDGSCFHGSAPIRVPDEVGLHSGTWERANYADAIEVYVSSQTRPDGTESGPPVLYVNDRECSVSQALRLAQTLIETVELYRSTGGKA